MKGTVMDIQTDMVSITRPVWDRLSERAARINGSPHNLADRLLRQKLDEMDLSDVLGDALAANDE